VGGVNHCSLHCNLARFRGLMIRGKYGAVIGLKEPIAWKCILGTYKKRVFGPITAPYFPLYIKPRNFAKRQCKRQWLDPSHKRYTIWDLERNMRLSPPLRVSSNGAQIKLMSRRLVVSLYRTTLLVVPWRGGHKRVGDDFPSPATLPHCDVTSRPASLVLTLASCRCRYTPRPSHSPGLGFRV